MDDLAGLTVVSVEHAVAAPYASCKLADAGARVIKVERPEGDFARNYDTLANGNSAYFVWLNRGKESIALNLKETADKALLTAMLEKADVFIQNLGPGVIDRLGLASEELAARHPRLIICSISGYGSKGPRASQKAYDLLIQAETGLAAITGTEHGPARVGVSVCDIAAGMTAYQAILEALIGRSLTGQGRQIEVSLFHALADWMNVPFMQYHYGGKEPGRPGLKHPTVAPYGAFDCADGKPLLLSVQNDWEFKSLCEAFGEPDAAERPEFCTNSARVAHRDALDRFVGDNLKQRGREENIALLEEARIAIGRLSDMDDVVRHPQQQFITVPTPTGPIKILGPGATRMGTDAPTYGDVPELDQHGPALRKEFSDI